MSEVTSRVVHSKETRQKVGLLALECKSIFKLFAWQTIDVYDI